MSKGLRRFLLGVAAVVAVAIAAYIGAQNRTDKVANAAEVANTVSHKVASAIRPLCGAVKFQNRTLHTEHEQKLQQRIPHSFFPSIPPAKYRQLIAQSKAQERAIIGGLNRVFVRVAQVPYC